MAKAGLIHDYDLMANSEGSAKGNTCLVCETENTRYQWSDYSGEAMCTQCGCPYQLKWGTEQQEAEGAYPYLNLQDKFLPLAKAYWAETGKFVHYGQSFSRRDGLAELDAWMKSNHPDFA